MRIPFFPSAAIGLLYLAVHQAHAGSPGIVKLNQIETEQINSASASLSYFIVPSDQSDFSYFKDTNPGQSIDIGMTFNSFSVTSSFLNIDNLNTENDQLEFEYPNVSFNYNFGQGYISLGYSTEKFEPTNQPFVTSYNTNIDFEYTVSEGFDIYTSLQLNEFEQTGDFSNFESHTTLILGTSVSF